jgi:dihydrolipoamide dehydrogenase
LRKDRLSVKTHDLIVIGAGPGGYVAAIRAAQLGLDVACIEDEETLGGTCARVGCIPSKALLEASQRYHATRHDLADFGVKVASVELDLRRMLERKSKIVAQNTGGVAFLFKKNKIVRYRGHGRIVGHGRVVVEGHDAQELAAKHVLIATGSSVAPLRGVTLDGDRIGTSTEALSYPEVPQHLVVIGAGYIGLELGSVWSRLGAKVTVLEYRDRILPNMDAEIALEAERVFSKQGIEFRLGEKVTAARREGDRVFVSCEGRPHVECDRVLLSVGRMPNTARLGLESVGIELDAHGRVPIDDSFRTPVAGFHAIGDVVRGPMLAHKAQEEGVACVEHIVTGYGHVNYDAIPSVVYTHPELASVGKTEDELKAEDVPYKKGLFPFLANGRARIHGAPEGRVKLLAHRDTDRVLGVHILGAHAGDLIAEAVAAISFGATAEDLARTPHAHPTLAEIVKEAAFAVSGRALHL